ncbi:hypothetical protein NSZ01_30880 [Nocardioides szechwanensis]|uniref:Uncharacterized protein n=1 Tax=Nocardioides szechwanensis TaxID=1005944 RepID=A0A1H0JUU6_9ACTN|nr:hypothetical protein [Nocardioides szechwanensis]GEP35320.1 hypothetical protein NSZ01_30880 [Nocardioides szechwanensis]SDO47394.1 hypothetical protein SAMN05192576_4068 [Nocardioides szechwanensis]
MSSARAARWSRAYGASGWHLALMLASLAVVTYVVLTVGLAALWDPDVWWQSIAVWFVGAVVLHDLVLFPAYALVDRLLRLRLGPSAGRRATPRVPLLNYVRVPTLVAGLTFLLFFPAILSRGGSTYANATGLTQEPFLQRWLLLVLAAYLLSALLYVVARLRHRT